MLLQTISTKYKIEDLKKWADGKKECNYPGGCSEKKVYDADSYLEIFDDKKKPTRIVKEIRCPKHGIVQHTFFL